MTRGDHVPKIDPTKRLTRSGADVPLEAPGNPALAEWAEAGLPEPDIEVIRDYRIGRIREQLRAGDFAGAVLFDPLNIRYALDASNMQVWCTHNAVRYAFIGTEGPTVLFDFLRCEHLSAHLSRIDERRTATSWFYFENGPREGELVHRWAQEIADLVVRLGGGDRRIAIDKCEIAGVTALERLGIESVCSQSFTEHARRIKHPEEIKAMRRAINTAEVAMSAMWRTLRPGITENQLWSTLHAANIARGGEWIETRLLASGPRTNPWFSECSDRVIEAGDIVSFDTDLIGPYGSCADISRAWVTPDGAPNGEQRTLHAIAMEKLAHNRAILRPGMAFWEVAEQAFALPEKYLPRRYTVIAHGVGLCDEYPAIRYPQDWDKYGYNGVIEPGQVLCLEAYVGEDGGREGVKLENQVLVTETGVELLDQFSMELVPE